ncbi:hypothetical protein O3P69_005104 [Scylla paramamosain]|uniref:Uncharacterized protein n=1 Tax=Scylla paramamosain TaxID=85552 RepID=A0AAW0UD81_SCYPA
MPAFRPLPLSSTPAAVTEAGIMEKGSSQNIRMRSHKSVKKPTQPMKEGARRQRCAPSGTAAPTPAGESRRGRGERERREKERGRAMQEPRVTLPAFVRG